MIFYRKAPLALSVGRDKIRVSRGRTWIMGLPRMCASGLPSKREEAKRAGMMPTARLRNPLGRRYRYAAAAAAAAATPSASPWTIHARPPEADEAEESDDGGQIGIAALPQSPPAWIRAQSYRQTLTR